MENSGMEEEVKRLISSGGARVAIARDPVNRPMIHHLCDALGDKNPIYLDSDSAAAAGYTDVVAPPSALQVWNMPIPGESVSESLSVVEQAYNSLRRAGFSNVVAVNCEQEYTRYLVPGDILTCSERVEHISDRKATKLGPGYFITTLTTYTDQNMELVGSMRFRTLWYSNSESGVGDE